MHIVLKVAAALALVLCLACKREEASRGEEQPKDSAAGSRSGSGSNDAGVPPLGNEVKPVFNSIPVPSAKLESMEVILSESEKVGHQDEIKVFVILYDQDQNMSSSDGKLELRYTVDGANEEIKEKVLEAAMFRKQVIPGEEEPSLSFLADILTVQPGQTLKVTAIFADLFESDDSITLEELEAPTELPTEESPTPSPAP